MSMLVDGCVTRFVAVSVMVCLLGACGGGGGSSSSGGSSPPGSGSGGSGPGPDTGSGVSGPPPPTPNQSPRAIIAANPTSGWVPLTINFDGGPSSDPDGSIVEYRWDFGDGSAQVVGRTTSHVYTYPGAYLARLTIRDNRDAVASVNTIINVAPEEAGSISSYISMGTYPHLQWRTQEVLFLANSLNDLGATIVRYTWDFGDGSPPAVGATARHSYAATGVYTVSLHVVDDRGRTGLLQRPYIIEEFWLEPSLGGSLLVPPGNARDIDVNSVGRPQDGPSNDSFATAQLLVAPVTAGGSVNLPGAGPDGALRDSGDPSDFFRVTLQAGNRARLEFDPSGPADLDLFLYDSQGNLVDASVSNTGLEEVVVPIDGDYVAEVRCEVGAAVYRLSIAPAVTALANGPALRLGEAFLPGRAVHQRRPDATRDGRDLRPGRLTLAERDLRRERVRSELRSRGVRAEPTQVAKLATLLRIKQLQRGNPSLVIEPEFIRRPLATFADPSYPTQWNLRAIEVPQAWDLAIARGLSLGAESIVAVVDSGILADHPDLAGALLPGYDFVSDPQRAMDGDGNDADPTDPGGPEGYLFHGTHVAGVIAARRDNYEGGIGVAPHAQVMPVRALGPEGGTSYDVAQAIRYAAGLANDSGTVPARRADIINLSLGSEGFSSAEADAVQAARAAGAILVAAAGNDGSTTPNYPASFDGVFSIGASGPWGSGWTPRTDYSNYGPHLDALAPGGWLDADHDGDEVPDGILGPDGDDYALAQGTSFAAAHVSGMLALMRAADPMLTEVDVRAMLSIGLLTTGTLRQRSDTAGYGTINARKAMGAVLQLVSRDAPEPGLVAYPAMFDFGYAGREFDIDLRAIGSAPVLVHAVEVDAAWAHIVPRSVDDFGLGTYRVIGDRWQLEPGNHTANVIFRTATGEVRVPIRIARFDYGSDERAGSHRVLLVDAETGSIVESSEAWFRPFSSTLEYTFNPIPSGRYYLIASTDYDQDGLLCEVGEACGIHPRPEAAEVIEVGAFAEHRVFLSDHRFYVDPVIQALFPDGIRYR